MRKLNLMLVLVAGIFLFSGCDKDTVDKLLTFYISDEQTFEVKAALAQSAPLNYPLDIPAETVEIDSESQFNAAGTAAHLVKDVSLDKLTLTLLNPTGEDLSFLKKIEVYFSDMDGTNMKLIAKIDVPDNVGNSIDLESTKQKLDRYIKAGKFKASTVVVLDEQVTYDVELKSAFKFKVTADPL